MQASRPVKATEPLAECRGGLEVDLEIEPLRTLYRQLAWLGTMQDFRDVIPASSKQIFQVGPVSNETPDLGEFAEQGNEGGSRLASASSAICLNETNTRGIAPKYRLQHALFEQTPRHARVIRDLHFDNFSFERERPYRLLCRRKLKRVEAGDAKDCYAREPWNNLFE
jgi:hypothetical protein